LEKLIVVSGVQEIPCISGTQMFITMFRAACHWTLSCNSLQPPSWILV